MQPIWPIFEVNGLDWLCFLAGSSKMTPKIQIFSIVTGADYSYEVKNSEIQAPALFKHYNSFIATVFKYITIVQFPMYLSKSMLAAPLNPKVQSMGAFWCWIFLCSIHNAFDQLTNSILQNYVDPKQFKLCKYASY